jgi:hypothetical protein
MAKGTQITHLTLAGLLEEPYRTGGYYNMANRMIKQLRQKHSIFLGVEWNVGYKIIEPGREIDHQDGKCSRATKQYVRAVKGMNYINIDGITDEPLKQRTLKIAQDRANVIGLLRMGSPEAKQIEA